MEAFKGLMRIIVVFIVVLPILTMTVYGQITTACSNSMISSFTPCLNFITGSSGNGSSPTRDCCSALSSALQNGADCACLILTGNVPFQLPINRTMAISLPQACNMASVPLQCRGEILHEIFCIKFLSDFQIELLMVNSLLSQLLQVLFQLQVL